MICEPEAGLCFPTIPHLSARGWPRRFGGSLNMEIEGALRLSRRGLGRLLLVSNLPSPEWGLSRFRSFSAGQSNLGEENRPADYAPCANLDGEEVCSVAFRFQDHRQICTFPPWVHCYIQVWPPKVPSPPPEWWHPSTVAQAPCPASCHFLWALPYQLRRSSCLPLQECLSWAFDISFCRVA